MTDRQTDRRTDGILIARPRLHYMQRSKKEILGFPTIAIGCQLLLITNMKSHRPTGFRFVPIPMTLNDLELCNSPYFAFLTEFDSFAGRLCHSG